MKSRLSLPGFPAFSTAGGRLLILSAYVALNLFFITRHVNWRDEAQAWLLARDLSPVQLFRQMSYEGYPCLWHLLLMPLAKLGLPLMSR